MFKKKLFLFSFVLFGILTITGCNFKGNDSSDNLNETARDNSEIIFFYGTECPHCKKVEEYFAQNKTAEKIQFSQREVYHDKSNAALMAEKAATCGIGEKDLGVPMLWIKENKCLFGDKDIIDFFNQKTDAESAK